jgi:hypothetical protein
MQAIRNGPDVISDCAMKKKKKKQSPAARNVEWPMSRDNSCFQGSQSSVIGVNLKRINMSLYEITAFNKEQNIYSLRLLYPYSDNNKLCLNRRYK